MSYEYTGTGNYGGLSNYYAYTFGGGNKNKNKNKNKNHAYAKGRVSKDAPRIPQADPARAMIPKEVAKGTAMPSFMQKMMRHAKIARSEKNTEVSSSTLLPSSVALIPKTKPEPAENNQLPTPQQEISLPLPPKTDTQAFTPKVEMPTTEANPAPPGIIIPPGMIMMAPGMMAPGMMAPGMMAPAYQGQRPGLGPGRFPTPPPRPTITPQQARLGTMAAALGAGLLFF